jgi:hypothetical protein
MKAKKLLNIAEPGGKTFPSPAMRISCNIVGN